MTDHLNRRKPSKSRKHLAKGRPDFVNMEFEPTASVEQDALEWRDSWISDMTIKHGRDFDIRYVSSKAHVVEDLIGKTVIIELRYTPEGK